MAELSGRYPDASRVISNRIVLLRFIDHSAHYFNQCLQTNKTAIMASELRIIVASCDGSDPEVAPFTEGGANVGAEVGADIGA